MKTVLRRRGRRQAVSVLTGVGGVVVLVAVATSPGAAGSPTSNTGSALHTAKDQAGRPAAVVKANPARIGRWSKAFYPGSRAVGISATLLHTGKVLLMGDEAFRTTSVTSGYLFDPATRHIQIIHTPSEVFCGGFVTLGDGRMLSVGGTGPKIPQGLRAVYLFNPTTHRWIRQPNTPLGRYYPTVTELPSGRAITTAGTEADGLTPNPTVEVYTPPRRGKKVGTLKVVGPHHTTPFYPLQWVMPDGNLFQVKGHRSFIYSPARHVWRSAGVLPEPSPPGASGMLLPGGPKGSNRVMTVGGVTHGKALASTEIYNFVTHSWSLGHRLPQPRAHMNLVVVPNGSAFGIGGNSVGLYGAGTFRTLRYNPKGGTWTGMALQHIRRAYHSSAVLLPDGRILSAGDTGAGGGGPLLDIYSPPYLFHGKRPVITAAPKSVKYGARFRIGNAGRKATQAVLMRPGSTTHADEMQARRVVLAVRRTAGGFSAKAPRPTVAPPGYYMLFTVTAGGTPSHAKWIHVGYRR